MKVEFDQICALLIFFGCGALLFCKIDGEVKTAMTLAVGYLVGTGVQSRRRAKGGK